MKLMTPAEHSLDIFFREFLKHGDGRESLKSRIKELTKALELYADESSWVFVDGFNSSHRLHSIGPQMAMKALDIEIPEYYGDYLMEGKK